MAFKPKTCSHLATLTEPSFESKDYCEQCREEGSTWVHLRTCQNCGMTLCCDSSPKKHASAHHAESGHSVIASAEAGEQWFWCYDDRIFSRY